MWEFSIAVTVVKKMTELLPAGAIWCWSCWNAIRKYIVTKWRPLHEEIKLLNYSNLPKLSKFWHYAKLFTHLFCRNSSVVLLVWTNMNVSFLTCGFLSGAVQIWLRKSRPNNASHQESVDQCRSKRPALGMHRAWAACVLKLPGECCMQVFLIDLILYT